MASAAASISFHRLTSDELRQWVQDHPGHIEDWDLREESAAAVHKADLTLVQWLIDTQGANVNGRTRDGHTALLGAATLPIVRGLLERGADPTLVDNQGWTILMAYVFYGYTWSVSRMLEDRRVVELINAAMVDGDFRGWTALHLACRSSCPTMLRLLVEAGANPCLQDKVGRTPLQLPQQWRRHTDAATMAVLVEEYLDAQRAATLLRLRRVMVKKQGVEPNGQAGMTEEEERALAFVVGVEGGCPRDVFTHVMDLLLPKWHPLRKGLGGGKGVKDSTAKKAGSSSK